MRWVCRGSDVYMFGRDMLFNFGIFLVIVGLHPCRPLDDFYFSVQPEDATAVAGQNVTLQCRSSREASLRYYWQQNGRAFRNTSRRHQVGSSLVFTRVDPEKDGGHFTCIAENTTTGFSLTSRGATIDIKCQSFRRSNGASICIGT
ncbi:unnamed protein product [Darwinula stevensoni]|uniref:Ig-like domain-containing protein n=1 Tax=Darwinula stevensoni TaxID=69355 RepID=A0A7R9AA85_9CRUS|nr:unnamed protein product [Darwinula stevensoni]CAG0897947.1 unnamed protein product [Darwinula stevensoni]